ncbi:MAG TPA: calcium/proton exchanger [Longimicrobiaceae bacterium]|nr:calcium/proton exchanger [Longimicrobiaceae bacterium]
MIFLWLLVLVPISLSLEYLFHAPAIWVFGAAVLAIVPLAEWIRRATENVGERAGSAIGGLLNVTFGNVAELILAIFVLLAGRQAVVKAQITGSIIGNGLLGLGLAVLAGSWGRTEQRFNRERVSLLSNLLLISVIALLVPALFDYTERASLPPLHARLQDERFSLGAAVILILVYVGNLVLTLVTHRDVYSMDEAKPDGSPPVAAPAGGGHAGSGAREPWPMRRSLAVLVAGTAAIAWESELVAGALESTAESLGITTFFLGVTVLAVIGNAAEYIAAIFYARRDDMSTAMAVTVGSSIQVALFAAPVLVLVSFFIGHPMNLVFDNAIELIAVASTAFIVRSVAQDGTTNWFEGALLVATYLLLGLAFFYVVPPPGAG